MPAIPFIPSIPASVVMDHEANPDIDGGYWAPPSEGLRVQAVSSYAEASQACRSYIERNGLGSGNWTGGQVLDAKGSVVARISYNGRAWRSDREWNEPDAEIPF